MSVINCSEYGFDRFGTKRLAYVLHSFDPNLPTTIRDFLNPFLSWITGSDYFFDSFSNLESIYGTPIGKHCIKLEFGWVVILTWLTFLLIINYILF